MSDCIFCKIVNGDIPADIIYEDDYVMVFPDIAPKADIHLLMIPKLHIPSLDEITAEHDEIISHMMRRLPVIAKQQGLSGFRTIINTGAEGGQEVMHLHLHLMGGNNLPGFS